MRKVIRIDLGLPDDVRGSGSSAGLRDLPALLTALWRDWSVRGAICLLAAVGVLCTGAQVWLEGEEGEAAAALSRAVSDSIAAQEDIERALRLEAERRRLGADAEAVLALDHARDLWPRLMDRVSRVMPRYSWVDSLGMGKVEAGGEFSFVMRGYSGTQGEVVALEKALVGGPVSQAAVTSTRVMNVGSLLSLYRWEIQGRAAASAEERVATEAMPISRERGYGPETAAGSGSGIKALGGRDGVR